MRLACASFLLIALTGCGLSPAVNAAPVGGNLPKHCLFVREQVASGAMPLDTAEQWYAYCGPFQTNLSTQRLDF